MSEAITGNQERNIMILFLSNLHYKRLEKKPGKPKDSRNILGDASSYEIYGGETKRCIETNEAPLLDIRDYLAKNQNDDIEHHYLDAIFYFVTNKVKNCDKEGILKPKIDIYEREEDELPRWKQVASEEEFFWTERAEKLTGLTFKKAASVNDISSIKQNVIWRIPVSFDEDEKDPSKSSLAAVGAMEEAIKQYLTHENVPLKKCNIYADTTGGFRPANMAMSAVMQLLVYQDAKLRRAVYSDGKKVSDVQDINDMYRLVAGVDAFRRYGSAAELNEYFKGVAYPKLQELLKAMNKFSESVLLCQPNDIETNLQTLLNTLEEFQKELEKKQVRPPKVELFAQMVDDLRNRYEPMYHENAEGTGRETDRIAIIRWCVENELFQQASTFSTEWIPEYLIEHGVAYTNDQAIQTFCGREGYKKNRIKTKDEEEKRKHRIIQGKKYFLMTFCTKAPTQTGTDNLTDLIQLLYKTLETCPATEAANIFQKAMDELTAIAKNQKKEKNTLEQITDIAAREEIPIQLYQLICKNDPKTISIIPENPKINKTRWKNLPKHFCRRVDSFLQGLPSELIKIKDWKSKKTQDEIEQAKRVKNLLKGTKKFRACKEASETYSIDDFIKTHTVDDMLAAIYDTLYDWTLDQYENNSLIASNTSARYKCNYMYNSQIEEAHKEKLKEELEKRAEAEKAKNKATAETTTQNVQNGTPESEIEKTEIEEETINYGLMSAAVSYAMLQCGMMKTILPSNEVAVNFIWKYAYMRTAIRNKINHANEPLTESQKKGGTNTIDSIKKDFEDLKDYLNELDSIRHIHAPLEGLWKKEATS